LGTRSKEFRKCTSKSSQAGRIFSLRGQSTEHNFSTSDKSKTAFRIIMAIRGVLVGLMISINKSILSANGWRETC
jgi:hypothetical protein